MILEPHRKWMYLPLVLLGDISLLVLTFLLAGELFESSHVHLWIIFLIATGMITINQKTEFKHKPISN